MQETLEDFFRALRAAEIPVSPAEAIDAHITVDSVGYGDRTLLKDALCSALAKSSDEVVRFDDCFEMFFAREDFKGSGEGEGEGDGFDLDDADLQDFADTPLIDLLQQNDMEGLAEMMERAANAVGATQIRYVTQRGLLVRRILDQMGLRELEAAIRAQIQAAGEDGDGEGLREQLAEARQRLFEQARQYIDRQYELYARPAGEQLRQEFLAETPLSAVEQRDFDRMQRLVRKMAKKLATKYNRRRKHTRRGVLDVRRTLRRNMANDGIPFDTVWKQTKIERPRIVVICDVSRSVAAAARFLLMFLYSLNEVIAMLRAFAFSDHLVEISSIIEEREVESAIVEILERIGFRPTDYGQSLADFDEDYETALDRRTTIIMLGDGRTNNTDPRLDLFRKMHDRSKSVIWLNPEPETFWGTGDSEMDRYRPFCHVAKVCRTVQDLERIIDDVLKSYIRA
jgi:hypothetical protein